MHRLWRMCPSLPGVSDFCAGRSSREVEAIYGTQRELREGQQVHARRIRQTPSQVIARLTLTEDLVPAVLVEPEGLDWGNDVEALSGDSSVPTEIEELEDPLLELFRTGALLAKEQFLVDWRKQRRRSPDRCTAN